MQGYTLSDLSVPNSEPRPVSDAYKLASMQPVSANAHAQYETMYKLWFLDKER